MVSTAQHLSDLAVGLAERGHEVEVIASRRAYDHPETVFPKTEIWRGIHIHRIAATAFGKKAKWRRAVDFASFIIACCGRLCFARKPDVVVALTSPPLISFIGAIYAKLCGAKFIYWVMDLNPDEAIAAGWLRDGSLVARFLQALSHYSFRRSHRIIALDRFMQERILAKGVALEKIVVLPPWAHDEAVRFDPAGREKFREQHGLTSKFVVMYSGNHSPCHPLDTVLDAATALAGEADIGFVFVGGGSEFSRVQRVAVERKLGNVLCLPYQPLKELSGSLSAADLHLVVMGNPFVGLIHPCKIYNILAVGSPVLCITPAPSHLTEMLSDMRSALAASVTHGDATGCVEVIKKLRARGSLTTADRLTLPERFAQRALLPQTIAVLEQAGGRAS